MIHNDRQQRITTEALEDLKEGLAATKARRNPPDTEWVRRMEIAAIESEIRALERQLDAYAAKTANIQRCLDRQDLHHSVPLKEMVRRNWLTLKANDTDYRRAAEAYFHHTVDVQHAAVLHRRQRLRGRQPNEFALLAWQIRVLDCAQRAAGTLGEFTGRTDWIEELRELTRDSNGPSKAARLLARHGIALVVVRHLQESYLDGAAMLDAGGAPVIGLTLRFDRLDNFWFVLFHELGHVFLHLSDNPDIAFFDDNEAGTSDALEREADDFALNKLLPAEDWNRCFSRFATTERVVQQDAERLGIAASIIAGRIRRDRNDYTLLTKEIGQGDVRHQFEAEYPN